MSISHLLEDFTHTPASATRHVLSEESLEDTRLEAFEKGYQAGWDDASKAHADEQSHISAELARNLQDLSFTYREAFVHVTASLEPLLTRMVEAVLPDAAHHSLGLRIVSEVMDMAKDQAQAQLVISLAPENRERLAPLLQANLPMPVTLAEDEALGAGQAFLKFGQEERSVDVDGLIADITASLADFFSENNRQAVDG